MGIKIYKSAIKAALNSATSSSSFKKYADGAVDGTSIAKQAGSELAKCINDAAARSLSGAQLAAVGSASAGGVTNLGDGNYSVDINMPANFRPSLAPDRYGGVNDMAALFNNGYSASKKVFGMWHGHFTGSRQSFAGAHFVQDGVKTFGDGGSDYDVVSIDIDSRFT